MANNNYREYSKKLHSYTRGIGIKGKWIKALEVLKEKYPDDCTYANSETFRKSSFGNVTVLKDKETKEFDDIFIKKPTIEDKIEEEKRKAQEKIEIQEQKVQLKRASDISAFCDRMEETAKAFAIREKELPMVKVKVEYKGKLKRFEPIELPQVKKNLVEVIVHEKTKPINPILLLSDIQKGTKIGREEGMGIVEYAKEKAIQQFDELFRAIYSINTKESMTSEIECIDIFMLGDMFEGSDIFKGQAFQIDQNVIEQYFSLQNLITEFIYKLLQIVPRIRCTCVYGNHGRVGQKGENPDYQNWDYILYNWLETVFSGIDRVEFVVSKSRRIMQSVYDTKFLLMHGDKVKSWNSIPYYGLNRADGNLTKMLASKQMFYDYIVCGHFHQPAELSSATGGIIINGTFIGGSLFSLNDLAKISTPSQKYFAVHPDRKITWKYDINLEV